MLEEVSVQSATASNVKLLVSLAAPPIVCFSGKVTVATLSSSSSQAVTAKAISRLMKKPSQRKFVLFHLILCFFVSSKLFLFKICFHRFRYQHAAFQIQPLGFIVAYPFNGAGKKFLLHCCQPCPGTYSVKYWKMNCSQVL
mgnify:CR=1 FL=1